MSQHSSPAHNLLMPGLCTAPHDLTLTLETIKLKGSRHSTLSLLTGRNAGWAA